MKPSRKGQQCGKIQNTNQPDRMHPIRAQHQPARHITRMPNTKPKAARRTASKQRNGNHYNSRWPRGTGRSQMWTTGMAKHRNNVRPHLNATHPDQAKQKNGQNRPQIPTVRHTASDQHHAQRRNGHARQEYSGTHKQPRWSHPPRNRV